MHRVRSRIALGLFVLAACARVDVDSLIFTCASDVDCARGLRCHERDHICVSPEKLAFCGDRSIDGDERCDDGNGADGDGCSSSCAIEPFFECEGIPSACTRCGDMSVDGRERCDDGNAESGDGCSDRCEIEPGWICARGSCALCGNRIVEPLESCDYGDALAGDGCSDLCLIEAGYTCDAAGCQRCGNGIRERGELCDDGDGSGGCVECVRIELGWTCTGEVGEASSCEAIRYRQISAGAHHTCAVTLDGEVHCWGLNNYPNAPDFITNHAVVPADLGPVDSVHCGGSFTCAVRPTRTATCWGHDEVIVSGSRVFAGLTRPPADLPPIRELALGPFHACATSTIDDVTRCWGFPGRGSAQRTRGATIAFGQLACGNRNCCGIGPGGGDAFCWGDTGLGIDDGWQMLTRRILTIDVGVEHACGVIDGGGAKCFGDGDPPLRVTDRAVGSEIEEVVSGYFHNCARRTDGSVFCWGDDVPPRYMQLEAPSSLFTQLAAGYYHTCGVRVDQTIECWGYALAFAASP